MKVVTYKINGNKHLANIFFPIIVPPPPILLSTVL